MANISEYISKIKTAIYGKDVRGSLADGLDAVNKETEAATTLTQETEQRQTSIEKQFDDQIANMTLADPSSAELVAGRTNVDTGESYDTIGRRLDAEHADVTAQLADEAKKRGDLSNLGMDPRNITLSIAERELNVKDFGAKGDGVNDDTSAFQNLIDFLADTGGGVIRVPVGIYMISNIKLKSCVHIVGSGKKSELKGLSAGKLIELFDSTVYKYAVKNLYINGNNMADNGICLDRPDEVESVDGWDGYAVLEHVEIAYCNGDGLYLGSNMREGFYHRIVTHHNNGNGMSVVVATDNKFSAITSYSNQKHGIYERSSSNKWSNCKAFYNGKLDRSIYAGWYLDATWATTYSNCEAQENYGHGAILDACHTLAFSSFVASTNGIGGGDGASNPSDGSLNSDITKDGMVVRNSSSNIMLMGLIGEDYRKALGGGQNQRAVLNIDSTCMRIMAFLTENHQAQGYINNSSSSTVFEDNTIRFDGTMNLNGQVNFKRMDGSTLTTSSLIQTPRLEVMQDDGNGSIGIAFRKNNATYWGVTFNKDGSLHIDTYNAGTYLNTPIRISPSGEMRLGIEGSTMSFFGKTTSVGKQTIEGSISSGTALKDLITKLEMLGLIIDGTTN